MRRMILATFAALVLLCVASPARAQHSVTLNWVASVVATGQPPITYYQVWRGTTSGAETFLVNAGAMNNVPNLTYTDTTVVNGTTYFYVVYSLNSVGPSATPSNEVKVTIPSTVGTIPIPPTDLTGTVQ
jgi:hypothetical protein